uniref:Uncharacterized protein n=1 Tax=Arundo donax TaxID=35708 RepID=A0A0A9EPS9_ARUDO
MRLTGAVSTCSLHVLVCKGLYIALTWLETRTTFLMQLACLVAQLESEEFDEESICIQQSKSWFRGTFSFQYSVVDWVK